MQKWTKELDDTRKGINLCDKCGKPKEVWGGIWCPRCDVPKPRPMAVMDLLKSMRHIEAIEYPKHIHTNDVTKKCICYEVWDYIVKACDHFGNDRYIDITLPKTPYSWDWDGILGYKCSIEVFVFLYKLSKLVDHRDVIWWVSW